MAECPECDAIVELDPDDVEEGQLVSCPECGVELEVVNTNPVELDLAEEEEEELEDEEGDLEEDDQAFDEDDLGEEEDEEDEGDDE